MKRILCARFPSWPIDRLRRKRASAPDALVIVRTIANRQEILTASPAARGAGIRPGMTLTQARALCATVAHAEHEPHRDAFALEALARWMMRFTPIIAVSAAGSAESSTLSDKCKKKNSSSLSALSTQPSALFFDLTGCERTFHGLETLVRDIRSALIRFRIHARTAVAPTPGAAWAMTFSEPDGQIIEPGILDDALAPLPLVALRLEADCVAALHHLGVTTIAGLRNLPRATLPSRFGPYLLRRLDQALGRLPEPLVPLIPFAPIEARLDFEGVVESLEAVWIVFKDLVAQVVSDLARRGRGARELELEFFRPYAQTIRQTVRLSRPSREPSNLFNLLRCAMEATETEVGFLGIRLSVPLSERVHDEQIGLLDGERRAAEAELDQLIERLRIRLGDEAVNQPVLIESHVPEQAWTSDGLSAACGLANQGAPVDLRSRERQTYEFGPRPLHLHFPRLIGVIVSPSEDRDGRPISFTDGSHVHRLPHAVGPERIAGRWWEGRNKTRDYFDVENETGRRFWLFRVMETNRWYLHGEFE